MKIIPFAMKFVDPNLRFSIIPIMKQFGESIHEEMDYSKESENLKENKKEYGAIRQRSNSRGT